MLSTIASLVNPRRRRDAPVRRRATTVESAATPPDDDERRLARGLADALDDAITHRRLHEVRVLATSASAIAHRHPRLTERLARLRLSQHDVDGAMALIDASTRRTSSLRLLRCACLLQAGRRAEAHRDLGEWCLHSAAPIDARLMVALLDWELGDINGARAALQENMRQLETSDERTLMTALCLAVEQRETDRVVMLAQQLRQCMAGRTCTPDVDIVMATLGIKPPAPATQLTNPQLDAYVTELIAAEPAIAALVESLELKPNRAAASMLADAIERALPDLLQPAMAIEAAARLRVMLGQRDHASMLIDRGLSEHPMNAALALLRQSLSPSTPASETATMNDRPRSKAA